MSVVIEPSRVVKRGDPARLAVEREKMTRARRIGLDSGLFIVPEAFEEDASQGALSMQRISGLTPLRALGSSAGDIYFRVGASLATVHKHLTLPSAMLSMLPPIHRGPSEVFLHGDFSTENVCIDSESGQVVILDWQTSPLYGGEATYGSRYFDICLFIANLFKRSPVVIFRRSHLGKSVAGFIAGYESGLGAPIDRDEFRAYHMAFMKNRLAARVRELSVAKRVALAPANRIWRTTMRTMMGGE